MPTPDPRIDAYIAASADFAQPILEHLRAVVHDTCPDLEETKTDTTRLRRMEQALAWIAEGKTRNWKYEKC